MGDRENEQRGSTDGKTYLGDESALFDGGDPSWKAIDHVSESVVITDIEGRIRHVNPAFERMAGYSRDEVLGKNPNILKSGHQPEAFYQILWKTILAGKRWHGHFMNRRKDGSLFREEVTITPILKASGAVTHFIAVGRDISDRERVEAGLRQNQKLEAVGHLASGIAHEINTPMQFIGDSVYFIRDAVKDVTALIERYEEMCKTLEPVGETAKLLEEIKEFREEIDIDYLAKEVPEAIMRTLSGVERVSTIIRAMKDFAHPGTKEFVLEDPTKALRTALIVARNEYKYVAKVEENLGLLTPIPCLLGELNQVFLNLLINAADAIYEVVGDSGLQGVITLTSWEDNDWVSIAIADTGAGMTDEVRQRLFEPFFTTKPKGKGSGQGMPICKDIVETKHGGRLVVESEPGRGTTITVMLPKHNPNYNQDDVTYDETKNPFRR